MVNEQRRRDRVDTSPTSEHVVKDDERVPNPARPLPPDNEPQTEATRIETDALIEDRFEATDN